MNGCDGGWVETREQRGGGGGGGYALNVNYKGKSRTTPGGYKASDCSANCGDGAGPSDGDTPPSLKSERRWRPNFTETGTVDFHDPASQGGEKYGVAGIGSGVCPTRSVHATCNIYPQGCRGGG